QPDLAVSPADKRCGGDHTKRAPPPAQPVRQELIHRPQHSDHTEDDVIQAPNGRSPVGDGDHGSPPGTEHSVNFAQCRLVGLLIFYDPKRDHAVKRVILKWDVLDVPDAELVRSAELSRLAD